MIFKELDSPGIFQYRAMIKAYGNSDQADLALGVLNTMLAEDRVFPDASVFTTLINALCESTRSDAVDQAWAVLQLMDQNPKCIQLGIKPDTFAYNTFLKGLVTSKVTADYSNHCIKAVSVLDEMERRFQTIGEGQSVRAIPFSYNLALKVCMRACDLDQADAVLSRMEDRLQNPPPNIATYTDILLMYAALRTAEAAERAERIFLRVLALPKKANDPQLTPSVFLYGAAINAWTQSNDEQAPERVLKIYQQLCLDSSLEANTSLYADLIACLSKSTKSDVEKADEFLKVMEGKSSNKHTVGSIDVAPDRRHYGSVMNGWISHGEAERAADVLIRRMTAFVNGEAPRAQPTADNFYLVTNTFIRSDQLVQATEFIQHVQEWVIAGHLSEGPDLHTFVALQSAWERSSENNASNHAMWIESKIASWSQ